MQTSKEIRNDIANIQYYAKHILDLGRKQLETDVKLGHELGINTGVGSIRFNCLGCIGSASEWIEIYCQNILTNLEHAEKLDKELYKEDTIVT